MRKVLIIAAREYKTAVRSKAFLISLLCMPLLMFGGIFVQTLLKDHIDTSDKIFLIVDRTPGAKLLPQVKVLAELRNKTAIFDPDTKRRNSPRFIIEGVEASEPTPDAIAKQRFELSQRVKAKKAVGFAEIGPEIVKPPLGSLPPLDAKGRSASNADDRVSLRYQTNSPLENDFSQWIEVTVNACVMKQRASDKGLSMLAVGEVLRPVPFLTKKLTTRDAKGQIHDAEVESRGASLIVPLGLSVMMMFMTLVGTSPLLQSVFEEKTARIAEVLLSSARPFELMMGKLIGAVSVSLTTAAIYLTASYFMAARYGFNEQLSPALLVWFILFQILGVLIYGSLYIAIGAACSDIRETQTMVMPVMLVGTMPMFALMNAIMNPTGVLAVALSFFPFATPMFMLVRQTVPPGCPLWQLLLSIALMLATTTACVYAAGRIFRVGMLMQGKGANFAQMARWVIRG